MNIWSDLPHIVYRCFDADGTLLYIGHTHSIESRFAGHRAAKTLPSVVLTRWTVRRTLTEYPNKVAAATAERHAIWSEKPLLNTGNQQADNTPATRQPIIHAYVAYATERELDAAKDAA